VLHAGQTGDWFPHHVDAHWCAEQQFGQRVAHGTLILSVAVGMTAGDINPVAFSYGYDRIRFVRPVHIGDTITVTAEIAGTRPHPRRADAGYVDEQVTVHNHHGDVVLSLVHIYLVERRSPEQAKPELASEPFDTAAPRTRPTSAGEEGA
jgi:acyl dehydratase